MKLCKRCATTKALTEFNRMAKSPDGRQKYCRPCQRGLNAAYRAANQATLNRKAVIYQNANPDRRRSNHLRNRYGITLDALNDLLATQGGACLVCTATEPRGGRWSVDHDHACCPTEKTCGACIRGVICVLCNAMLGMANDDADLLDRAASYLRRTAVAEQEV